MWKPNPECNTKFFEIKNKPATIMGPVCRYYKKCQKNQRLLWKLYAGIARNVIKTQRIPWIDMRVLQRMKNVNNYLWPILRVLQEMLKKPAAIMGLICGYCIFENLLMKFIIKNDVGIICLKCVYCFKSL